jgi:hypothetical protein
MSDRIDDKTESTKPDDELTPAEQAEAAELAELAASLRAAHAPTELSTKEHDEILARVIPSAAQKKASRGQVIRVTFGVVSAMAIAAALLLYLRPAHLPAPQGNSEIAWARSRSTAPLFAEPFKRGESQTTARIDRIALAREHDFRENRFASRRVR